MQLSPQQIKKLKRLEKLANVVERGNMALAQYLFELEDSLDADSAAIRSAMSAIRMSARGERGEKGVQGDAGPMGPAGASGPAGPAGRDGLDGMDGRDGKDGRDGRDGKDGSPDTAQQIVAKINSLPHRQEFQIDASHIRNLPKMGERVIVERVGGFTETQIRAGTGISVSRDAFGNWVITNTGSGAATPNYITDAAGNVLTDASGDPLIVN